MSRSICRSVELTADVPGTLLVFYENVSRTSTLCVFFAFLFRRVAGMFDRFTPPALVYCLLLSAGTATASIIACCMQQLLRTANITEIKLKPKIL